MDHKLLIAFFAVCILIAPIGLCMYNFGLDAGKIDGYNVGYDAGLLDASESAGYIDNASWNEGKQMGINEGYENGFLEGNATGYALGYQAGLNSSATP